MASQPPEGSGTPSETASGVVGTSLGITASYLALILLLLASVLAWRWSEFKARTDLGQRFEAEGPAIQQAYKDRMEEYELALVGARGLFAQGFPISHKGWQAYVTGLHLDQSRPGIQGIGFSRRLGPGEGPAVERALHAEGLPWFRNWPPQDRPGSTIIFLEPMEGRNLRAFGFDMMSEPIRRAAMEQARDTGRAAVSGKVTLVQEDEKDPQFGFLLYLPVFPEGHVPQTLEARRDLCQGWVYSPFRMGDFSRAVLGAGWPGLRVEIFDGPEASPLGSMFDSHPGSRHPAKWTQTRGMEFQGRTWTLRLSSLPAFERQQDGRTPLLVLVSGLAISLLIFGLLHGLVRLRQRAHELARQMTAALREEEEHVHRILDSTSEGIYGLDMEGRCTFVNQAFARIQRTTPEALLGKSVHTAAHHHHRDGQPYPAEACPIYQALKSGRHARLEHEWFWREDGTGYWANVVVAPILVGGLPQGSVVTVEDVTLTREVEQAKHDFVSVVSHELRTPLTSIRGTLGLLGSERFADNPEQTRRLVGIALRNAERLGVLINDILDFEKLRSGRLVLHPEPVPLRDLLAEAMESNLPFAATYGVMLHLTPHPPAVTLHLDRKRMVQVLTNLLSNAAKFSPEGTQVELTARIEGARVILLVADQGRGIPLAFRDRIFAPFSQAEAPDTRSREGTGLGLAITKSLVEEMGGTLSFTSEVGRGTTFRIDLPGPTPA